MELRTRETLFVTPESKDAFAEISEYCSATSRALDTRWRVMAADRQALTNELQISNRVIKRTQQIRDVLGETSALDVFEAWHGEIQPDVGVWSSFDVAAIQRYEGKVASTPAYRARLLAAGRALDDNDKTVINAYVRHRAKDWTFVQLTDAVNIFSDLEPATRLTLLQPPYGEGDAVVDNARAARRNHKRPNNRRRVYGRVRRRTVLNAPNYVQNYRARIQYASAEMFTDGTIAHVYGGAGVTWGFGGSSDLLRA